MDGFTVGEEIAKFRRCCVIIILGRIGEKRIGLLRWDLIWKVMGSRLISLPHTEYVVEWC